jgi:alpha-N-arabinofuranosidase
LYLFQEALDGLEFARGASDSKWGSVRAAMGHPEPFDLKYVAVGNEDCWKKNYRGLCTQEHAWITNSDMPV